MTDASGWRNLRESESSQIPQDHFVQLCRITSASAQPWRRKILIFCISGLHRSPNTPDCTSMQLLGSRAAAPVRLQVQDRRNRSVKVTTSARSAQTWTAVCGTMVFSSAPSSGNVG